MHPSGNRAGEVLILLWETDPKPTTAQGCVKTSFCKEELAWGVWDSPDPDLNVLSSCLDGSVCFGASWLDVLWRMKSNSGSFNCHLDFIKLKTLWLSGSFHLRAIREPGVVPMETGSQQGLGSPSSKDHSRQEGPFYHHKLMFSHTKTQNPSHPRSLLAQ